MRMMNGNRVGNSKDSLDIMYQNLPCTLNAESVGTQLDSLTERFKPDILFIGEADSDLVRSGCPDGYAFVDGNIKGRVKITRVSAIVNINIKYKAFKINTMVPAVGVKVGEWTLVGIYREWAKEGMQETKSKEEQCDRLLNLTEYWTKITKKAAVFGDFNFDPIPENDYQRSLECIRTLVNDDILPSGWRQMIRGKTRFESGKAPSQLDHIYMNQPDKLMRTWNDNTTGYDHNMIGARVKSTGKIFKAETFSYRKLDEVTEEQFAEVWNLGEPKDIFDEQDPSTSLELWEHKVHRVLETNNFHNHNGRRRHLPLSPKKQNLLQKPPKSRKR